MNWNWILINTAIRETLFILKMAMSDEHFSSLPVITFRS